MKYLPYLFILFLTDAISSPAQVGLYATGGYQASWLNNSRMTQVIEQYNTSQNLEQGMTPFKLLHGPNIGAGLALGKIAINLSYTGKKNSATSSYYGPNGTLQRRDLQLVYNNYSLFLGTFPVPEQTIIFGLGIGIDYGKAKIYGRSDVAANINSAPYQKVSEHQVLSIAPQAFLFIGLHDNIFLNAKAYYSYNTNIYDFSPLFSFLDPVTAANTAPAFDEGKYNNFGLSMGLTYSLVFE